MVTTPPASTGAGTSPARAGAGAVAAVVGAAGLLLVLATWAASIGPDGVVSGGHVQRVQPEEATPSGQPVSGRDPLEEVRHEKRGEPPAWLGVIAFVLEVITVVVVLFLVSRVLGRLRRAWLARTRRRRRGPPESVAFEVLGPAAQVTETMAEDADEQRELLAFEGAPRNAIVACWDRFEQQAVRGGVERRPWQTTSEFVLAALDLVGADHGAVGRLADLYREARFSDHPMTEDHRQEALAALDTIHGSLRPRLARAPRAHGAGR